MDKTSQSICPYFGKRDKESYYNCSLIHKCKHYDNYIEDDNPAIDRPLPGYPADYLFSGCHVEDFVEYDRVLDFYRRVTHQNAVRINFLEMDFLKAFVIREFDNEVAVYFELTKQ